MILARIRRDARQILPCTFGIAGAALVAQTPSQELMRLGFGCWIVSNFALILLEWRAGNRYVAGMFAVYEVTAIIGFVNTLGA
jgi:hypothetical protein